MARQIRIAAFSFVERCSAAAAPAWRELHSSARVDPRKDHDPEAQTTAPHAGLLAFRIAQSRFRGAAGVCRTGAQGPDRSDPSGRTLDGSGASIRGPVAVRAHGPPPGGHRDLAELGRAGPESIRTRTHDVRDICCTGVSDYRRGEGAWRPQTREVYDWGNGAVVIFYHFARDMALLIRRFRLQADLIPLVLTPDVRAVRADSHAGHFMPSCVGKRRVPRPVAACSNSILELRRSRERTERRAAHASRRPRRSYADRDSSTR